ncbi:MAG TPA: UDP-N-acetylmuramate dehydrogenase [Candidatus Goldiibacteriota bacterium]|nr:UDP-N-acetylmuramate dehydrogenase [Candidatus Goldiibacteriota bacterium]
MKFEAELKKEGIMFIKNYSVKKASNFRVGGRVSYYITPRGEEELCAALKIIRKEGKRYMAAGRLTNVLFCDSDIDMALIGMTPWFDNIGLKGKDRVVAGAGVTNAELLDFMASKSLSGAEFLAGIPGTVGGAVYMNAGAFGRNISGIIAKIRYADKNGRIREMGPERAGFAYRHSCFHENGGIITAAEIKAKKSDKKEIKAVIRGIIGLRHRKHPWKAACAGSFFRNTPDISAGKLVELAGMKGASVGGAEVSQQHGNFIINRKNASFRDVIALSEKVKKAVYKKFGVRLKEEVVIVRKKNGRFHG